MSEYQYYEFLAVDRPLTANEMAQLRAISSRAAITPTSFANHYEWGNLKADPLDMLRRYFDVFVYVANWGSRWLALRLPKGALDAKHAKPYLDGDHNRLHVAGDTLVLSLSSEDEPEDDFDEGTGWMASLAPLRGELLRGDMRPLYLTWLTTAQEEVLAEDSLEPPLPPGLGQLTPAQMRLAEFLRVDEFLMDAAADGSADAARSTDGIDTWIATLPAAEKDRLLVSVARGDDAHVGPELFRRFRSQQPRPAVRPQRTVGDLLAEAGRRRKAYEQEQARRAEERRKREAEEAARLREARLAELAGRQDKAWNDIHALIAERKADTYEDAVTLLQDLSEVAQRAGTATEFRGRLIDLANHHARKVTFRDKLRKAGLLA